MPSITELVDAYRAQGYADDEINSMIAHDMAQAQSDFIEDYEHDPAVQYGWHQQDLIDLHQREQ